jgi:uncharacterized protein YdhG (YjbR/CyaY superfamily)
MDKQPPASVDEYISAFPEEVQKKLREMRAVVRTAVPEAEEKISYQMPAYFWKGVLVYFGGFKDHISFFPTGSGISAFEKELTEYKTSKGTIQLPLNQPLPVQLITRIARFRMEENQKKNR